MAYDKPQVPVPNAHYPGHRHEDMQRMVNDNYNPGQVQEVIDSWNKIGSSFTELAIDFNVLVNGSADGWTGRAAQGARTALSKIGQFADKAGDQFTATGGAVAAQRDAADQAKSAMPQPVEYNPAKMMKDSLFSFNPVDKFTLPFDMMEQREKQAEAKNEAVRVMQQRDNAMMSATSQMPAFESTPQVTQDQGTTSTSSSTSSKSLSSVNSNQQFSANNVPPGMGNNGTTNPSWTAPPTTPPPNLPNTDLPGGNRPPGDRPGFPPGPGPFPPGRIPPGQGPNRGGMPPGGGRGPGAPGGPGAGGGRGPGGMGMGPGGMGRGAGSFGPATPGGSSGVMNQHGPEGAGRGGAAAGAAGRQGAAGMGGMGAGAGGQGQGGEDKEHKSTYLQPTDEYFDDDRMVAPPVIGG